MLEGNATTMAAGIRRRATTARLDKAKRKKADECASYLITNAYYLNYPSVLTACWPIAIGVIEETRLRAGAGQAEVDRLSEALKEMTVKLMQVEGNES